MSKCSNPDVNSNNITSPTYFRFTAQWKNGSYLYLDPSSKTLKLTTDSSKADTWLLSLTSKTSGSPVLTQISTGNVIRFDEGSYVNNSTCPSNCIDGKIFTYDNSKIYTDSNVFPVCQISSGQCTFSDPSFMPSSWQGCLMFGPCYMGFVSRDGVNVVLSGNTVDPNMYSWTFTNSTQVLPPSQSPSSIITPTDNSDSSLWSQYKDYIIAGSVMFGVIILLSFIIQIYKIKKSKN